MKQGFAFNDLLTNFERVAAHCSNVAAAMLELEVAEFDTHEYLRSVRQMKNEQYMACFDEYAKKYAITPTKKEIAAAKKEKEKEKDKDKDKDKDKEVAAVVKKEKEAATIKAEEASEVKVENGPEMKKEHAHSKKEHGSSKKKKEKKLMA
jgi:phosphate:Na+ symporter